MGCIPNSTALATLGMVSAEGGGSRERDSIVPGMIGHHQRRRQEPALLRLQLTPNGIGRFTDPLFGNKLSRHRRQHVIVLFE